MNIRTSMAVMLLACTLASLAHAQEPAPRRQPTPEETQKTMEALINTMAPAQARAAEAALDAQTKYAERPGIADRVAAYKRNLFEALMRRGFTSDQALQITLATPLPSMR